jgi:hypothetical protein
LRGRIDGSDPRPVHSDRDGFDLAADSRGRLVGGSDEPAHAIGDVDRRIASRDQPAFAHRPVAADFELSAGGRF